MLETARTKNIITSIGEPVKFEVSSAEDMNLIPDSSIDLLTAASAVHWFSMPEFWCEAARVLKPGGSVALIGSWIYLAHPTMPNATRIQEAVDTFWYNTLGEYIVPNYQVLIERFRTLTLPWDVTEPPVTAFERETLFRKEWGVEDKFFNRPDEVTLEAFEATISTLSPITKWREVHPNKVGTEHDCVRVLRRQIESLLHEAGVPEGAEMFKGWAPGMVLMVKKS